MSFTHSTRVTRFRGYGLRCIALEIYLSLLHIGGCLRTPLSCAFGCSFEITQRHAMFLEGVLVIEPQNWVPRTLVVEIPAASRHKLLYRDWLVQCVAVTVVCKRPCVAARQALVGHRLYY